MIEIAYYMDVHLAAAVTHGVERRGIDVLTSQADGTRTANDVSLLKRASELGRLLVTQDKDFLRIAVDWQKNGRELPGIIFAPQQSSIGDLVEDLELIAKCASPDELASKVTYLPLH